MNSYTPSISYIQTSRNPQARPRNFSFVQQTGPDSNLNSNHFVDNSFAQKSQNDRESLLNKSQASIHSQYRIFSPSNNAFNRPRQSLQQIEKRPSVVPRISQNEQQLMYKQQSQNIFRKNTDGSSDLKTPPQ